MSTRSPHLPVPLSLPQPNWITVVIRTGISTCPQPTSSKPAGTYLPLPNTALAKMIKSGGALFSSCLFFQYLTILTALSQTVFCDFSDTTLASKCRNARSTWVFFSRTPVAPCLPSRTSKHLQLALYLMFLVTFYPNMFSKHFPCSCPNPQSKSCLSVSRKWHSHSPNHLS